MFFFSFVISFILSFFLISFVISINVQKLNYLELNCLIIINLVLVTKENKTKKEPRHLILIQFKLIYFMPQMNIKEKKKNKINLMRERNKNIELDLEKLFAIVLI